MTPDEYDAWYRTPRGNWIGTMGFAYAAHDHPGAVAIEASVRYHLLAESRRKRIEYENVDPIACDVYRTRITANAPREK